MAFDILLSSYSLTDYVSKITSTKGFPLFFSVLSLWDSLANTSCFIQPAASLVFLWGLIQMLSKIAYIICNNHKEQCLEDILIWLVYNVLHCCFFICCAQRGQTWPHSHSFYKSRFLSLTLVDFISVFFFSLFLTFVFM